MTSLDLSFNLIGKLAEEIGSEKIDIENRLLTILKQETGSTTVTLFVRSEGMWRSTSLDGRNEWLEEPDESIRRVARGDDVLVNDGSTLFPFGIGEQRLGVVCVEADLEQEKQRAIELFLHYAALALFNEAVNAQRLEAAQQLQQARKMEAIGALAGGIAHDFNNILSPILGFTEMVMGDLKDDRLRRDLGHVFDAAERARDLVAQILDFSRQAEHQRSPFRLDEILHQAFKLLRASLPSTIEIHQKIDAEIAIAEVDPIQIHQVLMNLCSHSAQSMREKGGHLDLELTEADLDPNETILHRDLQPGRHLKLVVRDTGKGMEEPELTHVFEPYFAANKREGTGLGLLAVHGIIKSHGGAITVASGPEKGTEFQIYLPAVDCGPETVPEVNEAAPTGNERILFVDDESAIVDLGEGMLESLGYQVTARSSSVDALELFRSNPDQFDLVITDQTMPNMTGVELVREIMRIRPDVPTILCTGFSEVITETQAKAMGISEFLMKPVIRMEMAHAIRRVMERT